MQQNFGIMIGFLAETPLHPGSGQSIGTIDQPVAREGGTNYPFIPGSSHKGSTRADLGGDFYGAADYEGPALFSDIRLLLLPVRSSASSYRWTTCPLLLERFLRDAKICGAPVSFSPDITVPLGSALCSDTERLYLEERTFAVAGRPPDDVIEALKELIPNEGPYRATRGRIAEQLLILNDKDFGWFAQFGLPVQPRNSLDEATKSSKNLWYEEYLPSDTLMYGLALPRGGNDNAAKFATLKTEIGKNNWMRVGGNETVGHGLCRVQIVSGT